MKIEILYRSPEDLIKARTVPTEPIYVRINGRDVNKLSWSRLKGGMFVVSWVDPTTGVRYIRHYEKTAKSFHFYNKRHTKITLNITGRNEQEVVPNVSSR